MGAIAEINTDTADTIQKNIDPSEIYYHCQKLKRIHRSLRIYQNSWLQNANSLKNSAIAWADRSPFPLTWTGYLNSSIIDFRELGFSDHTVFYSLSTEIRNQFLQQQKANLERSFPELRKDFLEGNQIPSESRCQSESQDRFVRRAHRFYHQLQNNASTITTATFAAE
ncbi:MAG: hypothetical protein E4G98_03365 [Promethearchaeota archaeon]|nr:MAG: hypothetical protein E4G98_03365 [Candidatus Lokiarchaeota archaeon]